MKSSFAAIYKAAKSRYALFFLNGFLLASLLYFYVEDSYEKQLLQAMAGYVTEKATGEKNTEEAILLQSLRLTHSLGESRFSIFGNRKIHSIESSLIHPVTFDLMTANGACGSYAYILSALLEELNIPTRIAQMKVGGMYGGHNLVEAKTSKGWVVLDASYDLFFRRPDGSLASYADVMSNWAYYRNQAPANYNFNYSFSGVRYTNWNKIPVVMPAIKGICSFFLGKEKTEGLCLRVLFLRKFWILFLFTAILYIELIFIAFCKRMKNNGRLIIAHLPVLQRKYAV